MVAAKPRLLELEPDQPVRARPSVLAIAAAAALVVGIAGAVVASRLHSAPTPAPDTVAPAPRPALETKAAPHISAPAVTSEPSPSAPPPLLEQGSRAVAPPAAQESYAAELQLLRRAQSAYATRDFSGALAKLSEHSKRFPTGRLMEEREALRVRSLAGAGNMDQARRVFEAFAARFPRSVLLPRLRQVVQLGPD
jgi:TolA-binding protein